MTKRCIWNKSNNIWWRQTRVMRKIITTTLNTCFLISIMGMHKSQRRGFLFPINRNYDKKTMEMKKIQLSFNVLVNEMTKLKNSFKCNYHVIACANDEYCAIRSLWPDVVLLANKIQEFWYSLHLFYLKVRSMLNYFFSNITHVHCLRKQTPKRYPLKF